MVELIKELEVDLKNLHQLILKFQRVVQIKKLKKLEDGKKMSYTLNILNLF